MHPGNVSFCPGVTTSLNDLSIGSCNNIGFAHKEDPLWNVTLYRQTNRNLTHILIWNNINGSHP
jgi:hypothetical protein